MVIYRKRCCSTTKHSKL